MARKKEPEEFDQEKFDAIHHRVRDLIECHGHDIGANKFLRFSSDFIKEAEWLCEQVKRLRRNQLQEATA